MNFGKAGGKRSYLNMVLEENFLLIVKLKGSVKRMFGDKN